MIVLAHQESRRAKYKRSHQRIIQAAAAGGTPPQDAAFAGADEASTEVACAFADEPPTKRASTEQASDQPEQPILLDEADLQIAEIAQLNAQTAQILQDIGDLPEIDVDGDEEVNVSQELFL